MSFSWLIEVLHSGLATEGKCLLDKVIAVGDFDAANDNTMAVLRAKAMQGYVEQMQQWNVLITIELFERSLGSYQIRFKIFSRKRTRLRIQISCSNRVPIVFKLCYFRGKLCGKSC